MGAPNWVTICCPAGLSAKSRNWRTRPWLGSSDQEEWLNQRVGLFLECFHCGQPAFNFEHAHACRGVVVGVFIKQAAHGGA